MVEISMEFGAELRRRRRDAGLSQRELAQFIRCHKSWISKVETGTATTIASHLAQRLDDLLGAEGDLMALAQGKERRSAFIGLPSVMERLVGRAGELKDLGRFLRDEGSRNVCLLTGAAGAGKTTLAVRAGWDASGLYPDGCLYLDFCSHTPGVSRVPQQDALRSMLTALKVPEEEIPPSDVGLAGVYQNALRERRMLLVFDNVAASEQIRALLPAERSCRVLITSRNRLNALEDAVVLRVDALPDTDAAALFRSVAGGRAEGADAAVDQIVGYCARLPLAITIAAARFRAEPVWTVEDFAAELADEKAQLELLDDGERSVEAALALSCDALGDDERRMFGLLGLHPARRIRLGAAAALAGVIPARARRLLSRLADAHLVTAESADGVVMHDLLRRFVQERVLSELSDEERGVATRRLLDHAVCLTESCGRLIDPRRHRMPAVSDLADYEFADRKTALEWIQRNGPFW